MIIMRLRSTSAPRSAEAARRSSSASTGGTTLPYPDVINPLPADVSVVIPARDAEQTLGAPLDAVAAQGAEVIAGASGARDATGAVAGRPGARVIRLARGGGPGIARDAGVAAASAPLIAFTDSDCVPAPGWLAAGVEALRTGADLVAGPIEAPPGVAVGPFDRAVRVHAPTGLWESANLFVRREIHARAGGFGAGLEGPGEPPFGEDALFGWRAIRDGARATFAPQAVVHHAVTARTARGALRERRRAALFPALVRE